MADIYVHAYIHIQLLAASQCLQIDTNASSYSTEQVGDYKMLWRQSHTERNKGSEDGSPFGQNWLCAGEHMMLIRSEVGQFCVILVEV